MTKRIQREFNEVVNRYDVEYFKDEILNWRVAINGPQNTPYEGGIFLLDITFSQDFPFSSPIVKFLTKIFHPNINKHGEICLSSLGEGWKPMNKIIDILLEIENLLINPNIMNPVDAEIASLFSKNHQRFMEIAVEWTKRYAL